MSSTDSQNTSIIQYLKTAFQDFYNGVPIACSDLRPFLITCTARLRETYTDYSTFLWLTLDVLAAEDQDAARSKLSAMTGNLGIGVPSVKTIVESICGLFRSVGTYSGMCAVAAVVGSKVLGLVALGGMFVCFALLCFAFICLSTSGKWFAWEWC